MRVLTSVLLFFCIASGLAGLLLKKLTQLPPLPDIQVQHWGPGNGRPDVKTINTFKINVSDSEIKLLKSKLDKTSTFTPPLEGINFEYGFNTEYLKELIQYWKENYDWREREKFFNSLPQFTTQIGGLNIHFVHARPDPVKSKGKTVLPLLMLHGWPGSFIEFYRIIPLLTMPRKDRDYVFEVVAPSLPGYGFSEGAAKPGLGAAQIAALFDELMTRLKFEKYFIQGGDWGSAIGYDLSLFYPHKVLGFHCNYCLNTTPAGRLKVLLAYLFPSLFVEEPHMRQKYVDQFPGTILLEFGFFHIQATKPDSIGIALSDSPAGLASYILEKYSTWTNKAFTSLADGGLGSYDMADLLDQVSLYWFTNSITTSMRLYSETFNTNYQDMQIEKHTITVPTACIRMPNEILYYPKTVLAASYPNLMISDLAKGGHFAAFEQPQLLSEDIWSFVKFLRNRVQSRKEKLRKNIK